MHLAHETTSEQMKTAMEIIRETGLAHEHVKDASIYIRFHDITDYSMLIDYQYEVKTWAETDTAFFRNPKEKVYQVTTEMNLAILSKLEEQKIKFAHPILYRDARLSGSA